MKLSVINDPFPYIYVEDLYPEEELKLIWQELDYYQANNEHWFMGVDKTMGATENGKPMKQNTGFWLHDTFRDPNKSALARSTVSKIGGDKLFRPDSYYFKNFGASLNAFLVSHYEDGDYYKPHPDESIGSMVIWLYKEPKQFTGGEFIFTDYPDVEIPTKSNSAIVFPGRTWHKVNPVKMQTEDPGMGRYSFTLFFDHATRQ